MLFRSGIEVAFLLAIALFLGYTMPQKSGKPPTVMGPAEVREKWGVEPHQMRDRLMRGIFKPHQRLRISELSQAFGTSETPVREAISPDLMQKAEAGDLTALREIATKSGAIEDPTVKGALDFAEMGGKFDAETKERLKALNIDWGEGVDTILTAIRMGEIGRAHV